MGKRIAKHGYFCLVPDLYYRLGTLRFDIPRRNDAMSVVIRGAMKSLSNASVTEDTAGMIAFLDGQDKVKPGALGCVGHCMKAPLRQYGYPPTESVAVLAPSARNAWM